MENSSKLEGYTDALAMVGNEYRFALNSQMEGLACVVTGIDCSRDRPLFMISLNLDPGIGEYMPGETRLSDVSPAFLYAPEAIKSARQPSVCPTSEPIDGK